MAVIALRLTNPLTDDAVRDLLADLPEVVSCYSVAGQASHLLVLRVASPADLERLLHEVRQRAAVSTETTLVLSVPFEDRPLV